MVAEIWSRQPVVQQTVHSNTTGLFFAGKWIPAPESCQIWAEHRRECCLTGGTTKPTQSKPNFPSNSKNKTNLKTKNKKNQKFWQHFFNQTKKQDSDWFLLAFVGVQACKIKAGPKKWLLDGILKSFHDEWPYPFGFPRLELPSVGNGCRQTEQIWNSNRSFSKVELTNHATNFKVWLPSASKIGRQLSNLFNKKLGHFWHDTPTLFCK